MNSTITRRAALSAAGGALALSAAPIPAIAATPNDEALKARLAPIVLEMRGLDTTTALGETYATVNRFAD